MKGFQHELDRAKVANCVGGGQWQVTGITVRVRQSSRTGVIRETIPVDVLDLTWQTVGVFSP
jgi:hypothetical protein